MPATRQGHVEQRLTLAVIGAGQAGRSLAAEAVRAGHRVLLEDVLSSRLRAALDEIPTHGLSGSLELAGEVESAVRDADLAIDFVPDELESKLEIISLLDRMAPPKTVLCIPTETLSVNDLASCTYRGDRVVGMRRSPQGAALLASTATSPETLCLVEHFWRSLGVEVSIAHDAAALP